MYKRQGSGLAGLSVALHLAKTRKVAVISKRALLDGASDWAPVSYTHL
ncbi:FAD-binding protein, partial [Undibacterium sp. 10I3]|nr:FAD-binding protein [Undibacterium sp. 10I3]